jgi:hypothetical protein
VRIAGIAVSIATSKRPTVRIAVVDDNSGAPTFERGEEIPSNEIATVEQLFHLSRTIESRIRGLGVDRVIIRQADPMHSSRRDGVRRRLEVEGALAAAARSVVTDTRMAVGGKELGTWAKTSKADVDANGEALVAAAGENAKYLEAAAAALVGLLV